MEKNSNLQAVNGGAIRLSLAANVAHDLGALQGSLKDLAERLGHGACFTGCDIFHLGMEREFVVNQQRELNPQPLPPANFAHSGGFKSLPQDPVPVINVAVPSAVLGNIEQLSKVTASVLGKLGCAACCSGFDIAFRRQLEHFSVNEKLDVQRVAGIH